MLVRNAPLKWLAQIADKLLVNHPLRASLLSLLLLAFFAGEARAVPCAEFFSRVSRGRTLTREQADQLLKEVEARKVEEVFPATVQKKTGRRTSDTIVRAEEAERIAYERTFNQLWDARIARRPGVRADYNEYVAWLRTQNGNKPYPVLDQKILFDEYHKDGGTLAEYFDYSYIRFAYEKRKLTVDNVDKYLGTLDNSMVRNAGRFLARKAMWTGKKLGGLATGTLFGIGIAFPGQIMDALVTPFVRPTINAAVESTREVSAAAAATVMDYSKMFVGGETEFQASLLEAQTAQARFSPADSEPTVERGGRKAGVKVFDDYVKEMSTRLPFFHAVVKDKKPKYEDEWKARIETIKPLILLESKDLNEVLDKIDTMQTMIDNSGKPQTPAQMAFFARNEAAIKAHEHNIAGHLADWLFYQMAIGKEKPIDAVLNQKFESIYGYYKNNLNLPKLAALVHEKVNRHLKDLQSYATGAPKPSVASDKKETSSSALDAGKKLEVNEPVSPPSQPPELSIPIMPNGH